MIEEGRYKNEISISWQVLYRGRRCKSSLKADRNGKNILPEDEEDTDQQINLHSIKKMRHQNIHRVHYHVWMLTMEKKRNREETKCSISMAVEKNVQLSI